MTPFNLTVGQVIYLSVHRYIHRSFYLANRLSVSLSIQSLSSYIIHLPICQSFGLPVHLSVSPFDSPPVCLVFMKVYSPCGCSCVLNYMLLFFQMTCYQGGLKAVVMVDTIQALLMLLGLLVLCIVATIQVGGTVYVFKTANELGRFNFNK